jgi:hypothetical protein
VKASGRNRAVSGTRPVTVLTGTPEILHDWLNCKNGGARYDTVRGCQELSGRKSCEDFRPLLDQLYQKIDNNWKSRQYRKLPSRENCRLSPMLYIRGTNESAEKQLERTVVKLFGNKWFNDVPTASGPVAL